MAVDTDRLLRLAAASPVLQRNIVQVASIDGDRVRYLGEHLGRTPFATTARPGDTRDLGATAMGVAALAGLDPDAALAAISVMPEPQREETWERVAKARVRGYALDPGTVHPSVFGVAIPVAEQQGVAVGVPLVEVQPHAWREDARRYQEVVAALRAVARVMVRPASELHR